MKVENTLAEIKIEEHDSKRVVLSITGRKIAITESDDGFYIHMVENRYRPKMYVLPVSEDIIEII